MIFFGLLVHQTIEEIHRLVLDGELKKLKEPRIRDLFERTFTFLTMADVHPIGEDAKESAFRQVMNYFQQNQKEVKRIVETEVDVSVEKDGYILTGKIDLLMGSDGRLELLDFKTSPRPVDSPELLRRYEQQLCTYAHILERRHGKRVERLVLYWTAEENKADAIMEFPYRPEMVFASFIRRLYDGGINEYEDPDQPFVDATQRDSLPGVIPHLTRSARPAGKLWTKHISVAVLSRR